MKKCAYCGKELTTQQRHNTYCSIECFNIAKKDQKIKAWQNGEYNGLEKSNRLSRSIRNYLLEKANYKCELCGWGEINQTTGIVPLEIHHIDGNLLNTDEKNLQVLCPNCHSLTPNYRALNKDSSLKLVQVRKNYCIDCGIPINQDSTRCRACAIKQKITEKPVTREELKELIRNIPFTKIGEMYGVTDNAIRKWCIKYDLPFKKKDIKKYSDEEWEKI